MRPEIREIKEFFARNHITLCDIWLESCLTWLREQLAGTNYTKEDLQGKLYEQWLTLDLRDVEIPQLPANVNEAKKIVINQNLTLQVMSVVDISKSKLSQLQKIKNSNSLTHGFDEEKEVGLIGKRMLQLTLTDGVQEIKAIEYKTVSCLNLNLTPGVKIKLRSPITIRRGQIMLEPHNVKFLGGEVEDILVSHAAENVLARALHLPENPRPNTIDESFLDDSINRTDQQNTRNNCVNVNQILSSTNQNNLDISIEEELRIAAEAEMLFENEQDMLLEAGIHENRNQQNEEYIENEIEMLLEVERDILNDTDMRPAETSNKFNEPSNDIVVIPDDDPINSSLEDGNDLLCSFDIEKHLDEIEQKYHVSEQISLKVILDHMQNKKYGKYRTRAKFKSVLKKVTVKDDKWTVQIVITDGEDILPTYVHNDILTVMTGFSAKEATGFKQKIANNNQNAVQQLISVRRIFVWFHSIFHLYFVGFGSTEK